MGEMLQGVAGGGHGGLEEDGVGTRGVEEEMLLGDEASVVLTMCWPLSLTIKEDDDFDLDAFFLSGFSVVTAGSALLGAAAGDSETFSVPFLPSDVRCMSRFV